MADGARIVLEGSWAPFTAPATETPPAQPDATPGPDNASPTPQAAGSAGTPADQAAESAYKEQAYRSIASSWRRSRTGVLLNFAIDKSGRVHDVTVRWSSGDKLVDSQAVEAVEKTSLPAFPAGMSGTDQIDEKNFDIDGNYFRFRRILDSH